MNETYLILERSIQHDLHAIERIFQAITWPETEAAADQEALIVLAYRFHNLYNAFENIFQNIAQTFENNPDDASKWHAQLLQRMRLDVMPIRPAVINDVAYDALDELRRFRHVFRYSYDVELDPARLGLVWQKAETLQKIYAMQINQFLAFLQALQ